MYKLSIGIALGLLLFSNAAMATCPSFPYTLTNGTTADATQVMADLNTIGNCINGSTINFTGSVGIGTTPSYILDVEAGSGTNVTLARFDSTTSASSGAGIRISNSGTTRAWFGYGAFGGPGLGLGDIGLSSAGALGLSVGLSPTIPALYISTSTNVGINTTSPSYTLHVNGSVAGTSAYNNLSDARLKKNVAPLTGGLSIVAQLQPVRFDWRLENEREVGKDFNLSGGRQIGFIAQDVGKVLPEAVSTAKGRDAIMSVAESKIVPVLVAAVKELKATNDNQAAEIRQLKSQLLATSGIKTANDNQETEIAQLRADVSDLKRKVHIQTASR